MDTGFLNRSVTLEDETFRYQVYVPHDYSPAGAWPLILFLHGAGERGEDGLLQTTVGIGPALRAHPERFPAIVVLPQVPLHAVWSGRPAEAAVMALDSTQAEFNTDADRVYLTGISMGGNGAWSLAHRFPQRFAALLPVCGWTRLPDAELRGLRHVPTWIVHGEMDGVVHVRESRRVAEVLDAAGADVRYTELPGVTHNAWDPAYHSAQIIDWLFAQRRS